MQRDALSKWSEMIMTMITIQVHGLDSDVERENQSQLQQYILYNNNNKKKKKKKKKKKTKKNDKTRILFLKLGCSKIY